MYCECSSERGGRDSRSHSERREKRGVELVCCHKRRSFPLPPLPWGVYQGLAEAPRRTARVSRLQSTARSLPTLLSVSPLLYPTPLARMRS